MVQYLGDFAEDATVYIYFNTFSSDDPSASVTATTLANTDIHVYKDGSETFIATDGATVILNHDTTDLGDGVHLLTIDTSAHADYAIGSDYMVRIEGATVDAGLINAAIATFSIENRYVTTVVNTIASDLVLIEASIASDQIQNDDFVSNIHSRLVVMETANDSDQVIISDAILIIDTAIDSDQVQNDDFVSNIHSRLVVIETAIDSDQVINDATADTIASDLILYLDTAIPELGVAAPAATPTMRTGLMLLYMALRNKLDVQTSGTDALELHNDAGTQITSKLITDDTADYSEAKMT